MYRLFEYLKNNSNLIDTKSKVDVKKILNNLDSHAKDEKTSLIKYCWDGADIFYVPRHKLAQYYFH